AVHSPTRTASTAVSGRRHGCSCCTYTRKRLRSTGGAPDLGRGGPVGGGQRRVGLREDEVRPRLAQPVPGLAVDRQGLVRQPRRRRGGARRKDGRGPCGPRAPLGPAAPGAEGL